MCNKITIGLEFYFKGNKYSPSLVIDLDEHVLTKRDFDSFYVILASSVNIDTYSYEYEMMLAQEISFSAATGLATIFLDNGNFDFPAFRQTLQDERLAAGISKIASDHLSVNDLSSRPELKTALTKAYQLGQKS